MQPYKKITISGIGEIFLRRNPNARHYSLRVDSGKVFATIPRGGKEDEMIDFINSKHNRIRQMLQKSPERPMLNENTDFQTSTFSMKICRINRTNIYAALKNDVLTILCPETIDFSATHIQEKLWKIIEGALRHEAKRLLPTRLKELADKHNFKYSAVKINNSRTHWGSCTAKCNINLSLSLMLLPQHLIDYVLIHELCHTVEMNHGNHFHAILDKATDGKAEVLRKELKTHKML